MLSRFARLRFLALSQGFSRRFKSNWIDGGEHATHNDLPVPDGSWSEYNSRRNARNNMVLVSGFLALAASVGVLLVFGDVNFNFFPPKHWKNEDEDVDDNVDGDDNECVCEK